MKASKKAVQAVFDPERLAAALDLGRIYVYRVVRSGARVLESGAKRVVGVLQDRDDGKK